MTEETNFNQPVLDPIMHTEPVPGAKLPETTAVPKSGALGDDALSRAIRESNAVRAPVARPAEELPPPKFALSYVLDGQEIEETHVDAAHAIASYRRLRQLGIQPQVHNL